MSRFETTFKIESEPRNSSILHKLDLTLHKIKFYGKIELTYQDGILCYVKTEQTHKPQDLATYFGFE